MKKIKISFFNNKKKNLKLNNNNFYKKAIAYTDGGYSKNFNIFTCGVIIFFNNKVIEFKAKFNNKKWLKLCNIAGEIMGVVKTINYCLENKIDSILIFHDYIGLSKWANDEWKTNSKEINLYKKFISNSRKKLKINFKWVKSHSNNKNNDWADFLASDAHNLNVFSPILLKK